MKISFIAGLVTFWTVVVAIMVAGLISYESQKSVTAQKHGTDAPTLDEVTGLPGVQTQADTITSGSATAEYMTNAYVSAHSSEQDCWLIIDKKIYAVSDYIPFHPGGKTTILPLCGKEATDAFTTKGGEGKHSVSAWSLLENYYLADLNTVIPGTEQTAPSADTGSTPATDTTEAPSDAVGSSKFSLGDRVETTDTVSVRKQPGATGEKIVSEVLATRGTVKGASKWVDTAWWAYVAYADGNTGWSSEAYLKKVTTVPVTTVPTPPTTPTTPVTPTAANLTTASVATHNSKSNCWLIINNKVYNVTEYIPFHPGGTSSITNYCGKEATNAFNTKGGGGGSHSTNAHNLLANYYVGTLGAAAPVVPVVPVNDTTAPTVSFQNPLSGNTISGTVTISAVASDASGIASVKFSMDGSALKTDSTSPYSASLDTTGYSNTSHTLTLDATDKAGNVGTASITVTISNVAAPAPVSGLTTASVATHNSQSDCYLIINNKVYDVTQYIPFHPGGTSAITNYCGKEATSAFNTKGGGGGNHSTNANNLLANYYVGALSVTTAACTSFTYSSWGSCQPDSTQTRSVNSSSPSGCTGGSPVTTQSCVYTAPTNPCTSFTYSAWGTCQSNNTQSRTITTSSPTSCTGGSPTLTQSCVYTPPANTCTSFTYSSWGACQSNNTQTRTVNTSSPTGCTGGTPVTSQSCTYTPPFGSFTAAQVATHNTAGNCYLIVSNKVYDVTQYIPFHPGGTSRITTRCGTDATSAFLTSSAGHAHSVSAQNLLSGYFVGNLVTTCTSFTYSAWGTCQADSTQTRTVNSSSPTGCTGGSPITSQSCVYTPPTGETCTSFTYSAWGACQADSTQTRSVNSSSPAGCSGGSPVTSQSCTYTPPATPQTYTVSVSSSGSFSPSSLTINVGDSLRFTYTSGDEQQVSFSPSTITGYKLDHEKTTFTRTFSTVGTWTFSASGNTGTVTVQ